MSDDEHHDDTTPSAAIPEKDIEEGGLNDNELLLKDRAYAPSSERETAARQESQETHADVDPDAVETLPGTGGPDDYGDVEVGDAEIHIPRRKEAR
jgi:hypothetical protein